MKGSKILVLGITSKKNCSNIKKLRILDVRELQEFPYDVNMEGYKG